MSDVFTNAAYAGGTGGSIIPPFYSDFVRENLWPSLYMRQLGTRVTIPRNYGDKVKIPRWESPLSITRGVVGRNTSVSAITSQTESPVGGPGYSLRGLSANFISGQVKQFFGARGYNDKLIIVAKANYFEGALESLSRELAWAIDDYTRAQISANSTLRTAGSTANKAATSDGLFGKNIAKIAPYMDANNVPRWPDGSFVGVFHPLSQYDVFRDPSATGFVSVARYNDARMIYRGEVGEMYGIRMLLTNSLPKIFGSAANSATYGISGGATGSNGYVFAPDAFYALDLEGGGLEVIHHPLGSAGTNDPANQAGSIAVKVFYGVASAPQADHRLVRFAHGISLGY